MSYIVEKLYLGGLDEACDSADLHRKGVSHILTVEQKPLALKQQEGFQYKFVQALDMASADLLSEFEDCIDFINQGRNSGGVLVHCLVGQSRSATIVLAYLMHKLDLSLDDVLTLVQRQRPQIQPNPGFREQLELFESMGNCVDRESHLYKMYKLNLIATKMKLGAQLGERLPESALSADPSLQPDSSAVVYKCKKCRRPLFRQSCILPHEPGIGDAAFDWRGKVTDISKGASGSESQDSRCSQSLFIEPVQWMSNNLLALEGKISCPKCKSKLGSFNWCGERCPCGAWVTPAVHIQTSKVDKCLPRPASHVVHKVPVNLTVTQSTAKSQHNTTST